MLTIRFSSLADAAAPLLYRVHLDSPVVGQVSGTVRLPFDGDTQRAIQQALAPNFRLEATDSATRHALQPWGPLAQLPVTTGQALAQALCADPAVASHFDSTLHLALSQRQSLAVEMRFGEGCDSVAALPWELLYYRDHFLVADSSIALSRYPEGLLPPTPALTPLPLRVLLVLSEPLDAGPTLPQQARYELLHGLRRLDEQGAIIVDELRPPTFQTLTEALTTGEYHLLVFYGHGVYQAGQGYLLFEDEFGGPSLVRADALGALVRNSTIRLVLLGACESAAVGEDRGLSQAAPDMWSGTAPALVRAGVPLAVGMQVSMRVDAALAFLRQFALSMAAGKSVIAAVSDARKPLIEDKYNHAWFIPALYGRPLDDYRLFDAAQPLPATTAAIRARMQTERLAIERLEAVVAKLGTLDQPGEMAALRRTKRQFAQAHAELARRTPGGYAPVTSPLYGVPSNAVFVGRHPSLIRAGQGLKQAQPVVLWGPGGIGKSALAIEVAHRQGWRFFGGVLWLDCRGGPAFDTLLDRVAAFCGLEAPEQIAPVEKMMTVRAALAGLDEPVLLILDNAEDVWDNHDVRHFLRNRPYNVQVLLTTRENPEETAWTLIELAPLTAQPMTTLFYLLAARASVKVPTQVEANLIPPIIAWLQGHPLALVLVVPLAAKRGLQRVWHDLQKHPLKGIEAAFAVSFERLTHEQQRLFTRLSVFTIPFAWQATEALLPDHKQVDELLDVLVQGALVQFDGARYSFHALLHQFAYAQLQALDDARGIHGLAAAYLQALSTQQARTPEEALEEVDQWEKAEIWTTFAQRSRDLVGSLDRLGYWGEIETRVIRAQAAVQAQLSTELGLMAQIIDAHAHILYKQTHWDEALSLWTQTQHLYEQVGDLHGQAQTYNNLGNVYQDNGQWDQAIQFYQQSLAISQRAGDIHTQAQTYNNLGLVYKDKGQWDKAIQFYQQSLAIKKQVDDLHGQAQTYNNLGLVYQAKGQWDQAIQLYQQSLRIFEQVGDIYGQATTYNNLGLVYQAQGQWDEAIQLYQQSLRIFEQVGDIHTQATTYNNLGNIYQAQGQWDEAIQLYQQSLRIFEQVGDIYGQAQTYNNLGLVYQAKGQWDEAVQLYQQSLVIKKQVGDIHTQARTYNNLGNVYHDKGQWDEAIKLYQQSLAISQQVGDIHTQATTYNNLGNVYQQQGDSEQAAMYMAIAFLFFTQLGAEEEQHKTGEQLVDWLGSVEAAQDYLAQIVAENTEKTE